MMARLSSDEVVIVLVADDNHSLDDDYPLQPNFSKRAAAAAAKEVAYDVGWVYHHQLLSWENVVKKNTHLFFFV